MDILRTVLASFFSIAVLFILTKMMGQRQMSQLSAFDYINGISIGSIAAEMATTEKNVVPYIVAMAVYAFVTLGISLFTQRFVSMRRFFIGRSLLLYYNNEFILKNMDKAKIDVNELLTQCRIAGHFDLSKLSAVFIEPNGNLSFLKVSTQDSVTPDDLKLPKKQEKIFTDVIVNGKIMRENLKFCAKEKTWLQEQLRLNSVSDYRKIPLATYDSTNDTLKIFGVHNAETSQDYFN